MSFRFTNKLAAESSLYLQQHAHNPVNWYPWGEEALSLARMHNKPILISIGYAACHWCHVMERESFEDEQVAAFMNEHFINIKIDREERPDLDQIYMDAVQAIAGNGGWPLNVFCTPDTKPFFGGTYFPPVRAHNRISWGELLHNINQAWLHDREALVKQSESLLAHISGAGKFTTAAGIAFQKADAKTIADNLMANADLINGGFGGAPKFPQTFSLRLLFEYSHLFNDTKTRGHAIFSLKKLINGGIYDHIGGGMARYSTDDVWLAPHFEKMLYDNALLLTVLSDAYRATEDEAFSIALDKTVNFLLQELKSPEGGFYASIDADSEGEEGKYYVWSPEEIDKLLGEDAPVFCKWFDISERGNWEGKNILQVKKEKDDFINENGISAADLDRLLNDGIQKLKMQRDKRIRPQTDDKILLGWNALLLSAFCKCYAATGNIKFLNEAFSLFRFLDTHFKVDGPWKHSYKNGASGIPAFLDDLAYMVEACLLMQEVSGDCQFLQKAETLQKLIDEEFLLATGYYAYTSRNMTDVLFQKTEIYDGAVPSGNSTVARNLHYLGRILDNALWLERSENMVGGLKKLILQYPGSFALWASVLIYKTLENKEIVVTGQNASSALPYIIKKYIPNCIIQSASEPNDLPLLRGKQMTSNLLFYYCRGRVCLPPVDSLKALSELIN